MRIGAIEAGGTKFVCGVCDETGHILKRASYPTRTPAETMADVFAFFANETLDGLGVGTFGPVEVDPASPKYGFITSTPKLAWANFDLLGALQSRLNVPMWIDTDVNAAALGEARWGAAQGLDSCVYLTVGTGIGGGVLAGGRLIHGLLHPECGHMFIRRHPDDAFAGWCPYHGDCLEGMAAGPAIEKRWGQPGSELADRPEVWELEAYYLAQAIANLVVIVSPQRVILGGGVMHQEAILHHVQENVCKQLNGYVDKFEITERIAEYIVLPGLGDDAGLKGSVALVLQGLGL